MLKLAESSGTVIYENENKLYITKKPAQWTSTWLFITGLTAFIFVVNGILQLFVFDILPHGKELVAGILIAIGILFAFIFWRIRAYRKKLDALPVNEMKWICIIDFAGKKLLDGQENILAPLEQVQLSKKMQFTSSSPELVLKWDKHILSLVEGNPFSGGIAAVEKALTAKGVKRK